MLTALPRCRGAASWFLPDSESSGSHGSFCSIVKLVIAGKMASDLNDSAM